MGEASRRGSVRGLVSACFEGDGRFGLPPGRSYCALAKSSACFARSL